MRHRIAAVLLGILLAAPLGAAPAGAQSLDRRTETETNVSYFYYARPGEATVQVSVWGTVSRTGIYEVPLGTGIDQLLTMTGGAGSQSRTERVGRETTRETTVQLLRKTGAKREMIYEAEVEEMLRETSQYPELQDGDVLLVKTVVNQPLQVRDIFTYVGGIASIIVLVERLINFNN